MTNKIFFPQHPVEPVKTGKAVQPLAGGRIKSEGAFNEILTEKLATKQLKFSNHAQERMKSRNIELSETDLNKVQEAVDRARNKGSRDSLILMKDLALLVSVKNNTVITAVDGQNMKENVFTNIDSAVIV
ncbi:MAG: TIGR02530 family flagellar biosynthesis protein [Bacillota bacterium]|nr:TIGR02530 family flagellar biosynthesis protein [Bacillota bacterium]